MELPTWSSCPEDFIARHREALESQTVSERLHHWIDLNFGYKLSGNAAIKSKNVHLSIVDNHQSLCKRGIVQLFNHPHPPKQYQTIWTSKTPPRIYSQNEIRQRMTRSTDDLSNKYYKNDSETGSEGGCINTRSSSKNQVHVSEDPTYYSSIERSTSLHSNVPRTQNQIILPKDYNPVSELDVVENMEIFLSKTFYKDLKISNLIQSTSNVTVTSVGPPNTTAQNISNDEGINAFTNKIFSDCFEENLMKDTKRLHNLNHKNLYVQNSTRNFKQIISNHRHRELQVIACIIVEIFLANKLRALRIESMQTLNDRIEACKNVLKVDLNLLPKCVQHTVKSIFSMGENSTEIITDIGLPKLSAHQVLQPFLANFLFPFPFEYLNVYTLLKTLYQYESAEKLLEMHTYFDCDVNSDCKKFDTLEKQRTLYRRKIAECKVMACAAQIVRLLIPQGYEQFNVVELILPHILDLLKSKSSSILAAWFLFDSVAVALGQTKSKLHLLDPILKLYDSENDERMSFLNSNFDSSMRFTCGTSFKSRKTIKLYHHSFLLRLIVRFGLSCFLNNFVPPLIEAIGGCKEPVQQFQNNHENDSISKIHSNKSYKMSSVDEIISQKIKESDEMFTFDNDGDNDSSKIKIPININLADSSDNDSQNIDQFETNSNEGNLICNICSSL